MPNDESLSESELLMPRSARDEAQLILGQIHGVVWMAAEEADIWLPGQTATDNTEPELTADDIRQAAAEVHGHFGMVHAALNTGKYDEELARVGFTGAQGQAKRKGFLPAIGRFFAGGARALNYVARLRGGLRWSATLIGSISAALKTEIERVPGAASAAEAIKEFVEVLLNATESRQTQESPPAQQPEVTPEPTNADQPAETQEPSREKQKGSARREGNAAT